MCIFRRHGRMMSMGSLAAILLFCLTVESIPATESPSTPEPGPFKVGFKTIERYDYSRTFGAKYDYYGNQLPGETARPIQICIWYPAADAADGSKMVYAEYSFPYPEDSRFFNYLSNVQNRELRNLLGLMRGDQGSLLDLNNSPMGAIRDAAAREGRYPLIVYDPDLEHGIAENAPLLEYLASHGFVVVTTHSVGSGALAVKAEQDDLETLIRDKEFALAALHDFPQIDHDHIGVMGSGYGALTTLIMAMRNGNIGAVVGLDGAYMFTDNFSLARQQANFNPSAMKQPLMQLCRMANEGFDRALFDSLVYCPRYLYSFGGGNRACFTHYDMIAAAGDTSRLSQSSDIPNYKTVCDNIRLFFEAHLKGNAESMKALKQKLGGMQFAPELLSVSYMEAKAAPPDADQFLQILQERGIDEIVRLNVEFRLFSPESSLLAEGVIVNLGYQYLRQRQMPTAIELFRMYTQGFPNAANSWDCFAEAHLRSGDNEQAIKYYKKALEVLETDTTTSPRMKEQIRQGATATLEGLEKIPDDQ
ncbi:MAG: hypothetical protein GY841_21440 [FCB group bacterium]|nr:hypothetical protein [FCB group bacterium]